MTIEFSRRAGADAMSAPALAAITGKAGAMLLTCTMPSHDNTAPELFAFHERMFEAARQSGKDVYNFDSLPLITKVGHFRRMAILEELDIRDPENSVSVDFGTGPWGFACVFPKLRKSKTCIGIDVSPTALRMAAEKDRDIGDRVRRFTCDSERIPLEDSSVDIFWGGEVIEHVRDPIVFLEEISRICRDGADVVLSTPNRDALIYFAHKQDYTIGPEHIALMSYSDLLEVGEHYLDTVECVGYESSIWPDIDAVLTDAAIIRSLQERARQFPALASGLVLHARNNKEKFVRNKRCRTRIERLWCDPCVAADGPVTAARMFDEIDGGRIDKYCTLNFSIFGRKIILLFWSHDWSGNVEIICGDRTVRLDLYSAWGGFKRVVIDQLPPAAHNILIRSNGDKRNIAHDCQVVFYKAISYTW